MAPFRVNNFVNGEFVECKNSEKVLAVNEPATGGVCAEVVISDSEDVAMAVSAAEAALPAWQALTVKSRAAIMMKFHHLVKENANELAEIITLENGKTLPESLAGVAKANETVEWSCSIPQLIQGKILPVSRGVMCQDRHTPIGIVASIVPFNFPIMVPMWTSPIALVTGNCVILKPSEKVPMTMRKVCELMNQAGVPPGVFQVINGQKEAVDALIEHPKIQAITFVGSSHIAKHVYLKASSLTKRVLALGGAKNHLVALEDCDKDMTATDIVSSFAGCAGQRCMAASVLLTVFSNKKEQELLLDKIKAKAGSLAPGDGPGCMGPLIDEVSKTRVLSYINEAEANGAKILLDGRNKEWTSRPGSWVGPTIIVHTNKDDKALQDEIFGPVLSVLAVSSIDEALTIENNNPFGNAACVYTQSGAQADYMSSKFRAGMIGINIGIPVPREPFSFGGLYGTRSKYGEHDITGEGAMRFFTNPVKITTKWGKFETGGKEDISQFK